MITLDDCLAALDIAVIAELWVMKLMDKLFSHDNQSSIAPLSAVSTGGNGNTVGNFRRATPFFHFIEQFEAFLHILWLWNR
jgi:hypothetical protein